MKLSRTGWNNVIIFSVMTIILLINATNNKLFPSEERDNKAEQLLLPQHSLIVTLAIDFSENQQVFFERVGRSWQLTAKGIIVDKTDQQIEQMMFAWQQSSGLVQAADIVIDKEKGVAVQIALAGDAKAQTFTLYPLADQLLIYQHQDKIWLSLPSTLAQQLLPVSF
jgi:hypothetical protein